MKSQPSLHSLKGSQQPTLRHINLPSRWSEVSLGQYFDWRNAVSDNQRITAITGLPDDVVRTIPLNDFTTILQSFEAVISKPEHDFQTRIQIGKKWYGFIPDLNRITTGEYLDLVTYHDEKNGGLKSNLLKVMGTLYRPITQSLGGRYQITDYDPQKRAEYLDDIRQMSMLHVEGAMVFFCVLLSELLIDSLGYSSSKTKTQNQTPQAQQKLQPAQ